MVLSCWPGLNHNNDSTKVFILNLITQFIGVGGGEANFNWIYVSKMIMKGV